MTLIRPATIADIDTIRQLATHIWWPTYSQIISAEQITYMLDNMYSENVIAKQIREGSQNYILLFANNLASGFASYGPRTENHKIIKLHKLYCLTNTKGLGYGKLLLGAVEDAIRNDNKSVLELNVNRHNPATGFYQKMGFEIVYSEDIDIGQGFWMNDYVMRKTL